MGDDERRAKRSRFDQTELEPRRHSRFDRRSRSPSSRQSESTRTRSPLSREPRSPGIDGLKKSSTHDPTVAAAAAAAKINAQLQAKKGIQQVDVPPIRSTASPAPKSSSPGAQSTGKLEDGIYIADGDYIKDIEVNDLRNRYTLTKGSTQRMIKDDTGAVEKNAHYVYQDVTTRGSYYPDKTMATPSNPPLYLHVTSTTREGLENAVAHIDDLMKQELPNLVDERRFRRREPEQFERDEFGRRKWPEERIPIDLEPIPGFNLRAQVVGQGGAYVKHIQQKTRCKVQIKGHGSGFTEHSTGKESDEPMYLHVAGPDPKDVQSARELCEDLLTNVREQYQRFKENPPQHNYGGYNQQRGDRQNYGGNGGYSGGGYGNHQQHTPPPSSMSPSNQSGPGATGAAGAVNSADYSAQYAQYYGDPYAAYGGYQNYLAYYQYYQQAAQQHQSSVPPPPPSNEAPPPPPPPGAGSPPPPPPGGSYNAVPPPPGL
ncbi:hypothetical protein Egran_00245 [Elaphomyces granulatus]|uniref:K Homology domain-containing protein n=1 Tax=Elaphomyces granulatus TaxID=519963 RepID=A0A232M6K8_9EURO|nr:hypothetical protein Egran_00245 [Elaphomyces granulatus]